MPGNHNPSEFDMPRTAGRLITAQEDERRRIGRELHDHVTQRLALIGLQVDHAIAERREGNEHDLGPVRREIAELGHDVHDLSHRLHPTALDHVGLLPAL
jgi:signal transduction histidine kinase